MYSLETVDYSPKPKGLKLRIIIAIVMVIITLYFYNMHYKSDYDGPHRKDSVYDNITPMKHDVFKTLFVEVFIILVHGLARDERFVFSKDFFRSEAGRILAAMAAYFVFYELFQPYVLPKLPSKASQWKDLFGLTPRSKNVNSSK